MFFLYILFHVLYSFFPFLFLSQDELNNNNMNMLLIYQFQLKRSLLLFRFYYHLPILIFLPYLHTYEDKYKIIKFSYFLEIYLHINHLFHPFLYYHQIDFLLYSINFESKILLNLYLKHEIYLFLH